jgi:ElaB/YqjD/DUF883 family membrane-anchored ribosome-binding protein
MSRINETLKQKIDELDLDRRLNDLVVQAEQTLHRAVETAGDYAHEHREDVDRVLTRMSERIDQRTEGKYADQVSKVRQQVVLGVEKLAEKRPSDDA